VANPERDDLCTIVWNPSVLTLEDLAECLSVQLDLYREVAAPYVISELYQDGANVVTPLLPRIANVRMGSPLTIELISGSSNDWSIAALGMLAYILKNAEALLTLDLRIRVARAELRDRLKKLEERSPFQATGYPIRRFEQAYRSREMGHQRDIKRNRGRHR
jgi:hypothetical protein